MEMASTIWKHEKVPIRVDISLASPPDSPVYCVTVSGNPRAKEAQGSWYGLRNFWADKIIRVLTVNEDTFLVLAETPKRDRSADLEKVLRKMFDALAQKMGKGLKTYENEMDFYDKEAWREAQRKNRESTNVWERKEKELGKKLSLSRREFFDWPPQPPSPLGYRTADDSMRLLEDRLGGNS